MINIALADKRCCVRSAFIPYIEKLGEFKINIIARNENDLIQQIEYSEVLPDICIFGTSKESFDGYLMTRKISQKWPSIKVLIFTDILHPFALMFVKNYGATGYMTWNCSEQELAETIISVFKGQRVYHHDTEKALARIMKHKKKRVNSLFSENEYKVMELCSKNMCAKQIANEMQINKRTVDTYFSRIYSKIGIQTKEQLLLILFQIGFC